MRTTIIHLIIVTLAGLLLSCASTSSFSPGKGFKYQYTYRLVYPVDNAGLLFQDDSVLIQFKFDEAAIRFQLQNISLSSLSVDWSKAAMSINGRFFAVRHSSNLYGDTNQVNSISLPPLGYMRELALPRDNIVNDGDRWIETDLMPTVDQNSPVLREAILQSTGQRIGLVLPVMFGSAVKNYEFDFRIDTVRRIAWKDYTPVKRIPAPPSPKHSILALDNVTTAVIVVGVLGFSAYVLSLKKNPTSE